jgi:hypothetical protein
MTVLADPDARPTLFASFYVSYRDVFVSADGNDA